jgi:hypothetical protein
MLHLVVWPNLTDGGKVDARQLPCDSAPTAPATFYRRSESGVRGGRRNREVSGGVPDLDRPLHLVFTTEQDEWHLDHFGTVARLDSASPRR